MKLDKWALIAEIVGGVAIVLSLIFVGIEVRQSRVAQIQTGTQAFVSDYNAGIRELASNSELACIYVRGVQDYASLNGIDRLRLSAYLVAIVNAQQQVYTLMLQGSVDESVWTGFDSQLREVVHLPGFAQWFATRRHWYSTEFQDYVDNARLAQPETTPVLYDSDLCKDDTNEAR